MDAVHRGKRWRTGIGSVLGTGAAIVIVLYGQAFIVANDPASYYYQYFFGRIPWFALMGVTMALIGTLATVRLDHRNDPTTITVRVGVISMALAVVVLSVQQLAFQGLPFFFDFFLIGLLNSAWCAIIGGLPFLVALTVLQFVLRFTARPRSAREIMPPDLLAEVDARRKARH